MTPVTPEYSRREAILSTAAAISVPPFDLDSEPAPPEMLPHPHEVEICGVRVRIEAVDPRQLRLDAAKYLEDMVLEHTDLPGEDVERALDASKRLRLQASR